MTDSSILSIDAANLMSAEDAQYLTSKIRSIPGFPAQNITFRDFLPALQDSQSFHILIDALSKSLPVNVDEFDYIGGLEARGFLIGAPLAYKLNKGFIAFRKAGKLPPPTINCEYQLEYGSAAIEIEKNLLPADSRVLIVDDLIATGGTAQAASELVKNSGSRVVGFQFVIELEGLDGLKELGKYPSSVLMKLPA